MDGLLCTRDKDGVGVMRIGVHDRQEIQNLIYWKNKYKKVLKADGNKTNSSTDDRARGNNIDRRV